MLPLDLKTFGMLAGWARLSSEIAACNFHDTAADHVFPGAILPVVAPDDTVYWYGLAADGAQWRQLQPLLLAYAGPTVTSFTGQISVPDPANLVDQFLQKSGIHAMARLVPSKESAEFARVALDRLCKAIAKRPAAKRPEYESTARLLSRLDMCLATGDRKAAEQLLELLRTELRLDTLNVHFLQVRILAHFRSWRELVKADWFAELALARKPAAVAMAMLETLWHAHLAESASDESRLIQRYREVVQSLARPLLAQVSDTTSEIVQRLRALEESPSNGLQPAEVAAQVLLDRAADAPSNLHLAQAQSAIAYLPAQTRGTLLQSGAGQQAIAVIGSLDTPAPKNWLEWLDALDDPRFVTAVAVAREGVTEWPAAELTTAEQAGPLASSLWKVGLSGGLSGSRLIESLAALVQWVKEDPHYPRPALAPIYEVLLQLFDLLERRGAAERDAAADLFEALLSLGTTQKGYRGLLQDFEKLIDPGAGFSSVYWLIDIGAALLQHPSPDRDARLTLQNRILNSLQGFLGLLSAGQRAAYRRIAAGASWPVLPAPVDASGPTGLESLQGQSIAIYTLTESAGRQAEAVLKDLVPSVQVHLAHDHVGSQRLARLARDADLFILTTASAKHAATDCIVTNRGDRPLLYAAGRGFSSIVRAVEEYAARNGGGDSSVQ